MLSLPPLLRQPGFRLFWLGVAFTQIGSRATAAANLWQIQDLTDSIFAVGVVSLVEGVAVIGIAPLSGTIADPMDRKRLLQIAQGAALLSSIVLAITTFTNTITPLWIYAATAVVSGAATFDTPARQALIPALVPRDRLIDAYALIQPLGNLARLVGPAIAGLLIAGWGVGAVYVFDVVTYAGLIASLAFVAFGRYELGPPQHWWHSVLEGLRYVRGKPLIWQLMALDLAAVFFAAYRVVLPALARDVFVVGAQGYGFLAAVPALGGLVGAAIVYRLRRMPRKGLLVLLATMAYAIAAIGLRADVRTRPRARGRVRPLRRDHDDDPSGRRAAGDARPAARPRHLALSDERARRAGARSGAAGRPRDRARRTARARGRRRAHAGLRGLARAHRHDRAGLRGLSSPSRS